MAPDFADRGGAGDGEVGVEPAAARHRRVQTTGRRLGRPLRAAHHEAIAWAAEQVALPVDGALGLGVFFAPVEALWVEIGFGAGEHVIGQALAHPSVGFIAVEAFANGFAQCAMRLRSPEHQELWPRMRLALADGRDVLEHITPSSVDRLFTLFPDPWPKPRHAKRRLAQPAFVAQAATILKTGGRWRFATDWSDYAYSALEHVLADGRFNWSARAARDWRTAPADHIQTRYQEKALGDIAPVFLDFVRR